VEAVSSSQLKSYRQILKSSVAVGGASFVSILMGVARTKVLAVLLGPAGIGVLGVYNSIVLTASAFLGLGIGQSAVRRIAEAVGLDDQAQAAKSIAGVRRWSALLGLAGAAVVFALRAPISQSCFGDRGHSAEVGWLSLAVAAMILSAGQAAVLQGLRRVRFLAEQKVAEAVLGTLLSIPVVWICGRPGLVGFVVVVAAASLLCSWVYLRRVGIGKVHLSWTETWQEARPLMSLGMILMASGLLSSATLFLLRAVVLRRMGEEAVGYFGAAFSVSMIYLGFILQAMATDFYPRLTAAAQDPERANRLVDEQLEIALLLAGPPILAMLTFCPLIVYLLYTRSFAPAIEVMRWQVLGSLIRVIVWPVGFILLAKNQGSKFFACELLWNVTYLTAVWVGLQPFGLAITGTGFFAAYLPVLAVILWWANRATGYRLSSGNRRLAAILFLLAAGMLGSSRLAPPVLHYTLGSVITTVVAWRALTRLHRLAESGDISSILKRLWQYKPYV
jgi:O-antigen/teichoic acid export membrane protein